VSHPDLDAGELRAKTHALGQLRRLPRDRPEISQGRLNAEVRIVDGKTFDIIEKVAAGPIDNASNVRLRGPSRLIDATPARQKHFEARKACGNTVLPSEAFASRR
jgi:hypothetical protein